MKTKSALMLVAVLALAVYAFFGGETATAAFVFGGAGVTQVLSEDYVAYVRAHTSATTAKVPLVLSNNVVVPLNTALANANNVFVYRASKILVPKATGQTWVGGQQLYYDAGNSNFTTTATANRLCGYAVGAAASGDTEGTINLTPMGAPGAAEADLVDNSGGVAVDGTIAAVSSSATAADAIKELATKVNAILAKLRTAGILLN